MLLLRRPGKSGSQPRLVARSPKAMVKPRLPLPVADCDEPLPGCLLGPGEEDLLSGRRGLAVRGLTRGPPHCTVGSRLERTGSPSCLTRVSLALSWNRFVHELGGDFPVLLRTVDQGSRETDSHPNSW
jgi:hypothetical protein